MEDADRRFFVYEVKRPLPEDLGEKIARWIKTSEGKAVLLYHCLHEVNLEGFNPHGRASITAAKRAMMEASRSALDTLVLDVIEEVMHDRHERVAVEDLVYRFDPDGRKRVSDNAI